MTDKLTQKVIEKRLCENNIKYSILDVGCGVKIIVTEYGGRILGPFYDENKEGIFWVNNAFEDCERFRQFYGRKEWNLGGDRFWLAPEFQYNVKDKNAFNDTYPVPFNIDPGNYSLTLINEYSTVLCQNMKLETYNCSGEIKELGIKLNIKKTSDPLRNIQSYRNIMGGVAFAGYEHCATLKDYKSNSLISQLWNLSQIKPGGQILIPTTSKAEYIDYYSPADLEYLDINNNHVKIKIDCKKQFKVGIKSVQHFGRFAYIGILSDKRCYLLVKCFYNNPSSTYTSEVVSRAEINGCSLDIYHDDGRYGGYAEMECYGQHVGGDTGNTFCTDQIYTWLYIGDSTVIEKIKKMILGI